MCSTPRRFPATATRRLPAAAKCNRRSTIAAVDGVIDPASFPTSPTTASTWPSTTIRGEGVSRPRARRRDKAQRYLVLLTRSRFDVYPPVNAQPTGTHSAVFVPDRPALVRGNTRQRPAYVWLTDENGGCPLNYARMVSVESEIAPCMVGAFAMPDNQPEQCFDQAITEPNGQPRRRIPQQNHNPTVFKNLIFNTCTHGLRAIDISIPQTPREVGYALTLPHGIARTIPCFATG